MLSMLLLLASAPQTAPAPAHGLRPATIQEMIDAGAVVEPSPSGGDAANMPVLGGAGPFCASVVTRAADPDPGNGLMWREDGEPVGLYRLLDRRVDGCPDPIIVNYRVPGSNAVGRELRRTPAPLPLTSPVIVPRR